jgi:hypothetical protein
MKASPSNGRSLISIQSHPRCDIIGLFLLVPYDDHHFLI